MCHSLDHDDVDLSGLVESVVDSDEDDLADTMHVSSDEDDLADTMHVSGAIVEFFFSSVPIT